MSHKVYDQHGRRRNKNVGFRVSPEEAEEINRAAMLSGMKKQDFIYKRVMNREIIVVPNSRLLKIILEQTEYLVTELVKTTRSGKKMEPELKSTIELLIRTLEGLKGVQDGES